MHYNQKAYNIGYNILRAKIAFFCDIKVKNK